MLIRRVSISLLTPAICFAASASLPAQGRGRGAPVELPDGPGRDVVQATCSGCHALNLVVNDGYSRQEWQYVISTMVNLPANDMAVITDYLATHYPEKRKPPAVVIPGSAQVAFKEWPLPTK